MSEIKNNIEMNIKEDGGSYRALYPINDSFTKVQTLTSLVCDVMGIPETSTPADAFLSLALGLNSYGYYITFLYPDGSPVVNAVVTGATGISGEQLVTDSNGQVLAVSASQSISVSIAQNQIPYFDIQALSNYSISSVGKVTNSVVNLSQKSGDQLISSSQNVIFSSMVETIDIGVVGGGGGGGGSRNNANYLSGGGGGGGGYASYILSQENNQYMIIIGAGGAGGKGDTYPETEQTTGKTGGTTIVQKNGITLVSADGGNGGKLMGTGGVGNGRGGSGASYVSGPSNGYAGTNGTINIFEESPILTGGGGGGGSAGTPKGGYGSPGDGGKPSGGGKIPGGGGTGGFAQAYGSTGGKGGVYIRWHNKT